MSVVWGGKADVRAVSQNKPLVCEIKQRQDRQAVATCSFSNDDFDLPGCSDIIL